ncbi:MAG: rhodanese-like domain-containing protein [Calditrichia bacterium]
MNHLNISLSVFILNLLLLISCGDSQTTAEVNQGIDPEQAYEMIQTDSSVLVIDVRTPQEYTGELGHIPDAVLEPLQEIEKWSENYQPRKDQKIILVCRSGNRSNVAADYLARKGFKRLYNIEGGMKEWNRLDLPVDKPDGKQQ